ncbi:hypothetical protein BGZ83_002909 [Gryganskiella cystojenkinii]|nr:hypothetical protein BGZ83_002909 [Gryganskiella cystojenkinii]
MAPCLRSLNLLPSPSCLIDHPSPYVDAGRLPRSALEKEVSEEDAEDEQEDSEIDEDDDEALDWPPLVESAGDVKTSQPMANEERNRHLRIYSQLSRLTLLKELRVGVRNQLSTAVSTNETSSSENQLFQTIRENNIQFSLDSGLEMLSTLQDHEVLDVSGTNHKIGVPELKWIKLYWPKCKIVDLLRPRSWADDDWTESTSDVIEFLEQNRMNLENN